ncbi:hypothetical protein CC80DRAFT_509651 [Byssothecium circinans]|uniref:RING-type domain-containing protein n=1 Tax=Byssothecium circinans TaxID=147558 RepID=A0A6A5TNL7_9PLEO|nr:hypothetical protein CC80DRAFT_509651 [Byssothecium circinans]
MSTLSRTKPLPPTPPPSPPKQTSSTQQHPQSYTLQTLSLHETSQSVQRQGLSSTPTSQSSAQLNKPLPATPRGAPQPPTPNLTPRRFTPPEKMDVATMDRLITTWIRANTETVSLTDLQRLEECPICLDTYGSGTDTAKRLRVPGCGHIFGENCLKKILKARPNDDTKCPLCRAQWMRALNPPRTRRPRAGPGMPTSPMASRLLIDMTERLRESGAPPRLNFVRPAVRAGTLAAARQMVQDAPAANVAPEVARRVQPGPAHEVISIDSDSDDDNFEALTRDITEVRARARRTNLSRRERRIEDRDAARQRFNDRIAAFTSSDQFERNRGPLSVRNAAPNDQNPPAIASGAPNGNNQDRARILSIDRAKAHILQMQASTRTSTGRPQGVGPAQPPAPNTPLFSLFPNRAMANPIPRLPQPRVRNPFRDSPSPPHSPNRGSLNPHTPPGTPPPTLPSQANDSDSSNPPVIDLEASLSPGPEVRAQQTRKRSQRVQELQNEQKENDLKEYERRLNEKEKSLLEREQRVLEKERRIGEREKRVERIEGVRTRQMQQVEELIARQRDEVRGMD